MDATANAPVSWSVPTFTNPVLRARSSNPRNTSVPQGESFAGSHESPTPFVKQWPHIRELSPQRNLFILHPDASISLFASSCHLYLLTQPNALLFTQIVAELRLAAPWSALCS